MNYLFSVFSITTKFLFISVCINILHGCTFESSNSIHNSLERYTLTQVDGLDNGILLQGANNVLFHVKIGNSNNNLLVHSINSNPNTGMEWKFEYSLSLYKTNIENLLVAYDESSKKIHKYMGLMISDIAYNVIVDKETVNSKSSRFSSIKDLERLIINNYNSNTKIHNFRVINLDNYPKQRELYFQNLANKFARISSCVAYSTFFMENRSIYIESIASESNSMISKYFDEEIASMAQFYKKYHFSINKIPDPKLIGSFVTEFITNMGRIRNDTYNVKLSEWLDYMKEIAISKDQAKWNKYCGSIRKELLENKFTRLKYPTHNPF